MKDTNNTYEYKRKFAYGLQKVESSFEIHILANFSIDFNYFEWIRPRGINFKKLTQYDVNMELIV